MKIIATALDSFAHGCKKYTTGDLVEAMPGEIDDLRKAGLVGGAAPAEEAPAAEEDLDDLVGGEKMEEAPENKMAAAPANKKAR